MPVSRTLRRQTLGLLLGGLCSFAATAGETLRDETTIVARTATGTTEQVVFEGELAPGEVRALTTTKGNPAVLRRNDSGLVLEVAGESFDIAMPSAELGELADLAGHDAGEADGHRVVIRNVDKEVVTDANGSEERKVVVVKRLHDDAGAGAGDADLLLMDPIDPEQALAAAGEGKRVIVMRKLVRHRTESAPVQ